MADEQDSTNSAPDQTPSSPRKRRLRRGGVLWHGVRSILLLFLLPLAFLIVAGGLMLGHEVTAPTWVKTRVETEADKLLAGGTLTFGEIKVTLGRDLHPTVRLRNTILTDAEGRTIARIPQIAAVMSPRGLLLRQEVLVQTVDLTGAQISIRRQTDGSVAFAFDTSAQAVGEAATFVELLDQIDEAFEKPALEAMEQVRAEGLVLSYSDARAGRSWTVDGGALALDLRGGETRLTSDLSLLSGRDYVTKARLDYRSPRGSREASIDLSITDAPATDLSSQIAALSWLAVVDAKLSADLSASLERDGTLGPLSADLQIGQGLISPQGAARPVPFRSAAIDLTFDPDSRTIRFDSLSAQTDWGGFTGSGQAELQEFTNGWPGAILSQMRFADLSLSPGDLFPSPVTFDQVTLDTRLRLQPFGLEVGQFLLDQPGDGAAITGRATVLAQSDGWHAGVDIATDSIGLPDLLALWPASQLPGTRAWIDSNITGATLSGVQAGLRLTPGQKPMIAASWTLAADQVRYMQTLPPLQEARAFATLEPGQLTLQIDQGHVNAPQGGRIDLSGSVFDIPDLSVQPATAVIDLAARSTVTAALALLDEPPFGYLTGAGLPVTLADGTAQTTGRITLPLKPPPLLPGDVTFDMTAALSDLRSTVILPDRTLTASALRLTANLADGLRIEGPVRVGQVGARGSFARALGPGASPIARVRAEVDLGLPFLDEFRISLPDGTVSGQGTANLSVDLVPGERPGFSLTSTLSGIGLALPAIGWSKSRGSTGRLEVEGRLGAPPDISRLALDADGFDAVGTLSISPNGGLERARFSRVQIGNWFDAPVTLTGRGANRAVAIAIDGGSLDLRRADLGDSAGQGGPMSLQLDRLQISEGIALTDFAGEFDASGGFEGSFTARVNGDTSVSGTVVPSGGRSAVRIRGLDAGGAFRSIGLIRNASGGALDLTLVPTGAEGNYDGSLAVTDLRVKDAPALAGLLDAISVVGLLQQMDGQGLGFTNVDARFRVTPDRLIVTESSAVGPGLGISMDGTYTLASQSMEFQGVVSPLYLINGLGSFLTRRGEGLIGFNYTLRGPVDAMRVAVNPLSVLTPGMFRDIFRRPPPEVTQ